MNDVKHTVIQLYIPRRQSFPIQGAEISLDPYTPQFHARQPWRSHLLVEVDRLTVFQQFGPGLRYPEVRLVPLRLALYDAVSPKSLMQIKRIPIRSLERGM